MPAYIPSTVEVFGRKLILSGDLDPVYNALYQMSLAPDHLYRFLLAYACYYHVGFACYVSELKGDTFWQTMFTAARNEVLSPVGGRWPRGSERRHFRGAQGIRATNELHASYPRPEMFLEALGRNTISASGVRSVESVFYEVQRHRGFGDWISFKLADLLDRVVGAPVQFDNAHIFMFDSPVKGALMALESWGFPTVPEGPGNQVERNCAYVVDRLIAEFSDLPAPPSGNRPVNVQEVETVLCKWKTHRGGRYAVGHDIEEIRNGLVEWSRVSETAKLFQRNLPEMPD